MRASSETAFRTQAWRAHWLTRDRLRQTCILLLFAFGCFASRTAPADGCFVFKWNKAIDINEPTQKAIIVHDAGREDLLLQVKYEGPLEEFGWLIPVPSLPKVEKGSMEPFYELSLLSQRHFGTTNGVVVKAEPMQLWESVVRTKVEVIETKTVGAYEVAVLSAQDSGSLARWLRAHDYSLPEGKSEIVDDYIRRGWFFIAAKVQLNKGVAFKTVSSASASDSDAPAKARKVVQKQLASGELHPLLISFDTPKCVFPLKISAVNGRPSEILLYVISKEPLLEKFTFGKVCEKLEKEYGEWTEQKAQRSEAGTRSMQNIRAMQLSMMMYRENSTNRFAPPDRRRPGNWSIEDLNALTAESQRRLPNRTLSVEFFAASEELLHEMQLESGKIPKSAQVLPRLKGKDWQLTKVAWTFSPAEMRDLEFELAIPALARAVPEGFGSVAAELLARFGDGAVPSLVAACKSKNSAERLNAVCGLERARKAAPTEVLLALLKDEVPQVRFRAVRCADADWNVKFADALIALFRDAQIEIRQEASGCLSNHENTNRTSVYLALLKDSDPNVRMHSLGVAAWINRYAVPQEVFAAALAMLKDSDEDLRDSALHSLWRLGHHVQGRELEVPRADLLPLLNSSRIETVVIAMRLIEDNGIIQCPLPEPKAATRDERLRARRLSSTEAAPLLTSKSGQVRLLGLRMMQRNGDAKAVELTLPLLRETNSVIRSHASSALQTISGQNISDDDPAKWEAWWAANKASFTPRRPAP